MLKLLYYFAAWPFILFGFVVEFIVWVLFSDGRWRQRQEQPNPAGYWQGQALAATRELRELEITSRRQMDDMESWFRKELNKRSAR